MLPQRNGCVYFLDGRGIPEDWNDVWCYQVCIQHCTRMRDVGNVKYVTVDTPESIYIFCSIVACIVKVEITDDIQDADVLDELQPTLADFLRLPLVLD